MDEIFDANYEEDTQHGRYLTFTLEENIYGIPIRFVTEIIGIQPATKIPETPDFIKGIVNLRGRIVPLIDIRLKFAKEEIPYNERTCIIVVDVNGMQVGLIVDKVEDVLSIDDEDIAVPPRSELGFENRYIDGIGKVENSVVLLLNAEKLLKNDEIDLMASIVSSEENSL